MPRKRKAKTGGSMNSAKIKDAIHIVDEGDALDVHVLPVERVLQQPDHVFPDLAMNGMASMTALEPESKKEKRG